MSSGPNGCYWYRDRAFKPKRARQAGLLIAFDNKPVSDATVACFQLLSAK